MVLAGSAATANFGSVNLCAPGKTTPGPCSASLTLTYQASKTTTLGTIEALTLGSPNLDYAIAPGGTCSGQIVAGMTCTVHVTFTPLHPGLRTGGIVFSDTNINSRGTIGNVVGKTLIYGNAIGGPRLGFNAVTPIALATGIDFPRQAVVDGAEDVFLVANDGVVKIPAAGGPIQGIFYADDRVAIDGAGDLFLNNEDFGNVQEFPPGEEGFDFKLYQFPAVFAFESLVDPFGDLFTFEEGKYEGGQYIDTMMLGEFHPGGHFSEFAVSGYQLLGTDYSGDLYLAQLSLDRETAELYKFAPIPKTLTKLLSFANPSVDTIVSFAMDGGGELFVKLNGQIFQVPTGGGGLVPVAAADTHVYDLGVADAAGNIYYGLETPGTSANPSYQFMKLPRATPPILNFGTVNSGTTSTLPVTITNTATGTLTVSPVFDDPRFSVVSADPVTCLSGMHTGQPCTLQVQFSPGAGPNALVKGSLTLNNNGLSNPVVSLEGLVGQTATPAFSLASGVYATAQTLTITDLTAGSDIHYTTDGSLPTAASWLYIGPIPVNSTVTIKAVATAANVVSAPAIGVYTVYAGANANSLTAIDLSKGFSPNQDFAFNGSAGISGSRLRMTDGNPTEAGNAFYTAGTVDSTKPFITNFTFQLSSSNPSVPLSDIADGIAFLMTTDYRANFLHWLGGDGSSLGYGNLPDPSYALKFDLHNDIGEGNNSTGLCADNSSPTYCSVNLNGTGIGLHSGNPIFAQVSYDGVNLTLTLTDTATLATWSHIFTAYISENFLKSPIHFGFSGGTGGKTAVQDILNWTVVSASDLLSPATAVPANPTFPSGFDPPGMTLTGSASLVDGALQLTEGRLNEAGSAFYSNPVDLEFPFVTDFTFELSSPDPSVPLTNIADGITFALLYTSGQPTAVTEDDSTVGSAGHQLGFGGILANRNASNLGYDAAIKFDLHDNTGEGPNSTGLYLNGASPTSPSINLNGTGIDLHSGHPMHVHMTYDGYGTLVLTIADTITSATWSHSFPLNLANRNADLPPVFQSGNFAYVGFTASTGSKVAKQQILDWTFSVKTPF